MSGSAMNCPISTNPDRAAGFRMRKVATADAAAYNGPMRLRPLLLVSAMAITPLLAVGGPITQLVVFGDSLSDNGNAASVFGGTLPGNYAPNAFTDGPMTTPATSGPFGLWIDQFASKLGVSDPQPFVAGGTNYAVASALTGHNPAFTLAFPPTAVPYTSDQVALYLATHTPSAGTLYTFWAGANDINQANSPSTAANNIETNIQTLAAAGGTQFLWLNLPLLGNTPDGQASGQVAALNAASMAFNTQQAADVAALHGMGINVISVNIQQLFSDILAHPAAYGFTDVTDPGWCGTGGLATCASNHPNDFMFWDGEHPTTAADAVVANLAFSDATGGTSSVPEPSTLALALGGLCALALRRNRV